MYNFKHYTQRGLSLLGQSSIKYNSYTSPPRKSAVYHVYDTFLLMSFLILE